MAKISQFFVDVIGNHKIRYIAVIVTLIYVAGFLFWEKNRLPVNDPVPELLALDKKAIARASQVEVGLHINNFQGFSVQDNAFTLDGTLWFKFPIGQETLATIKDFSIKNSLLAGGTTVFKYPPVIKVVGTDVVVSYGIITTFKTPLNYHNFPMSAHQISMLVQHKTMDPHELYYIMKPENFTLGKDLSVLLDEWKPVAKKVSSGYRSAIFKEDGSLTDDTPTAMFTLEFESSGYRDLTSMYFPLLVLFLITLFSLLYDVTSLTRLGFAASAVPVLVLFRMVINGVSPKVGYTTHIDYFYYLLVFLCMLVVIFQVFVLFVLEKIRKNAKSNSDGPMRKLRFANDVAIYVILILLVVFTTYSYFR